MSGARELLGSAPGRANLLGNPSDLYGGAMISCSVAARARVRLCEAEGLVLATGGEETRIGGEDDLRLRGDLFDLARAVLLHLGAPPPRCRIEYASEIPLRSGLAGSTALVVALLRALLAWQGRTLEPALLAEHARFLERHRLGVVCGWGDQYMSSFGGLRFLDFRGKGRDRARVEDEPLATLESLAERVPRLPFVLAFTGVRHFSGAVHSPIRERWLAGEPAVVRAYERVAHLAREGREALLAADWARFGALMNENHAVQRELGGSGESNERLIAAALAAGAAGAKLAGAGHGGTIVALWPEAERAPLERALREAGAAELLPLAVTPGVTLEAG